MNAGNVSEQDKALIKAYIDAYSKNLLNGSIENSENLRRDRNALLDKLKGNISVTFRIAYVTELLPHVQKMLDTGDMKLAINALVLAGAAATDASLNMVVARLNHKQADIRFAAAVQLGFVFRTFAANEQRAINAGNITPAVRSLEQLIANEVDPNVRAELIRAGLAAAEISTNRNAAIAAVANGTIAYLRKTVVAAPTDAELNAHLRASIGLRDICSEAIGRNNIAPDSCRAVAELGAGLLNYTAKVVPTAPKPEALEHRPKITQLAASAQSAIELAGQLLRGAGGQGQGLGVNLQQNLAEANKAGDAKFLEGVRMVNVALSKPPYEIPSERLK